MTNRSDHPRYRLLPPFSLLLVLLAAWALQRLLPLPALRDGAKLGIGMALGGTGLGFVLSSLAIMSRARTSPAPHGPVTTLVVRGPYRLSRNPIYLGFALIEAALAVLLSNSWALLLAPAFVAALHWGAIVPEEHFLERRFGDAYRDYRRRVRAWI